MAEQPGPVSPVLTTPPAPSDEAAAQFARRLRFETDVSDVRAHLSAGAAGVVVVDTRSVEAWNRGHVPGAVHCPTGEVAERAAALVERTETVVTYCWGPACNGATRAALAFARGGYPVKEMIGGFEYWVREGFPYETDHGVRQPEPDSLTVLTPADCGC